MNRRRLTRDRRPGGRGRLGLLAAAGAGIGVIALDRALSAMPADQRPLSLPVRARVEIAAPISTVWPILADIPGQVRWMPEMKQVTVVTSGPVGVGSVAEAIVRIFGIAVRDRVVILRYEPPVAYGIEHLGVFGGRGLIELQPGPDGQTTMVRWTESLVPPLLPRVGWIAQRPIIARLYQRDLFLLRDLVEQSMPAAG